MVRAAFARFHRDTRQTCRYAVRQRAQHTGDWHCAELASRTVCGNRQPAGIVATIRGRAAGERIHGARREPRRSRADRSAPEAEPACAAVPVSYTNLTLPTNRAV